MRARRRQYTIATDGQPDRITEAYTALGVATRGKKSKRMHREYVDRVHPTAMDVRIL